MCSVTGSAPLAVREVLDLPSLRLALGPWPYPPTLQLAALRGPLTVGPLGGPPVLETRRTRALSASEWRALTVGAVADRASPASLTELLAARDSSSHIRLTPGMCIGGAVVKVDEVCLVCVSVRRVCMAWGLTLLSVDTST